MATTWRHVEPRRSVDVFHDECWHRGVLRGWRRGPAGWEAFVDVAVRPGIQFVRWVLGDQGRVPRGEVRPVAPTAV